MTNEEQEFYASLKYDSIVHYHIGHAAFVRCRVVMFDPSVGNELQPIALVGNWHERELPHYDATYQVNEQKYAQQIRLKNVFRPHFLTIYESGHMPDILDPRKLKPINLELPRLTAQQMYERDLWDKIGEIGKLIHESKPLKEKPNDILDKIHNIILDD